jgi:anti-sigma factor RsiW
MHQPIRNHLETYLDYSRGDSQDQVIPQEFHAHLAACLACAEEVQLLANQSQLLRASRDVEQLEPRPGFYARVMEQIERQREPDSFWSVFLQPPFGKRLAYACTALVLVLGTYLVSSEPGGDHSIAPTVVISQEQPSSDIDGTRVQPKDRDAVLVNLASFHE